jgi:tRNA(fMet)-specific endonuclease VapC
VTTVPVPGSSPLYLLDTNILLHYVRQSKLQRQIEDTFQLLMTPTVPLISYVTEAEIRSLAQQLGWGATKMNQLGFLLSTFDIIPIDWSGILKSYVEIDTYSVVTGKEMGKNDVWIAATARATSATLLTTDKDFDHLDPSFLSRIWIDPVI